MNYSNPMTIRISQLRKEMRRARNLQNKYESRRIRRILLAELIKQIQLRNRNIDAEALQLLVNVQNRAKSMGLKSYYGE